jgi:hypothetical protein
MTNKLGYLIKFKVKTALPFGAALSKAGPSWM